MFIIICNILLPFPVMAGSKQPNESTYFEYKYYQGVNKCRGAYDGYDEDTKGTGRYEVVSWGPDEATMNVDFSWTYDNNEGGDDSGHTKGEFSFDLTTREYTSSFIDVDDFYYSPDPRGPPFYQWLWIPPDIEVGTTVKILDSEGVVTDKDKTLWSRYIPRKGIEVKVTGNHNRDDDYGQFEFHFTDLLYFDKVTGMFFAERYEEFDEGYWEGSHAEFRLYIEIDVTESSYEIEIDWRTLVITYLLVIFGTIAIAFIIVYPIYRARWARRSYRLKKAELFDDHPKDRPDKVSVRIRRVWKPKDFPHRRNHATDYFEPFLEHWSKKAILAKDRSAVVVAQNYGLMGYALYNKEAKIGTILCKNTELTELLRGYIGCKDFFTESRHTIKPTKEMQKDSTTMNMLKKSGKYAYNVFENHNVYKLSNIKPMDYDTKLVRPMRSEDLKQVIALSKKIFKTKAKRWIKASFNSGELAYVAIVDERIVGFGFAEVGGTMGRLHTLGIDPEFRNKGIGKELHRARLEAMRLMGVTQVIDEIADWNLASIRISTLSGFEKIGKMYVETKRSRRIKKNIVRR
jgi:RimJ/RimL family protein N-acetyltransferase